MVDVKHDAPLDLSAFDTAEPTPAAAQSVVATPESIDARLVAQPRPERLVEVNKLSPEELAAAQASAARLDFHNTRTLLEHCDGVLAAIAQSSRQLLTGVRLGDAGEVGRIAAAVIDGVKILRIQDLMAEAAAGPTERKGLVGKLLGLAANAHSAFKGFLENRKKFLDLMDAEQAKARKTKADLAVTISLLDQQALSIRRSLHSLKIEIAAGQIALDRAEDELEALRQRAVESRDPAEVADVVDFRGAIANFRGKVAEMREALVGSAMLIPIIGQTRQAAETRMMKISNGMLVVIPRLMAVASQAVVHVEIKHAADQAARLDEANRQITLLAAKGAHEAATSAAAASEATNATLKCSFFLREALPDLVTVQESKGLFSRTAKTTGVTVELGDCRYILQLVNGRLQASVAMVVRGITLNTRKMDPGEWFAKLHEATQAASEHARHFSESLSRFMAG